MDELTKKLMQEAGFESGSVGELLGLDKAQETLVETKVRLTSLLREERRARGWSQNRLAQAMGKKQQVVARMEMAHRSVTLDLLLRALLSLGVKMSRIAREMEACEMSSCEQLGESGGDARERVEVGAISNLVPRERIALQSTISDVQPLLRVVRNVAKLEEHLAPQLETQTETSGLKGGCGALRFAKPRTQNRSQNQRSQNDFQHEQRLVGAA